MKTQGTSKINSYCTASLTLVQEKDEECIKVQVCYTHYGHIISIGHLRIPYTDRMAVASQLAQDVEVQHILDRIRDNLGDKFQRIHLLTRKDINNIDKMYGLKGPEKHKDDDLSVHMWVEEMKSMNDRSPVILYKPQGTTQSSESNNLCDRDFVLAVQTSLQADIMKKFGEKVICVDGTHGTNGYDFMLITVMVVDEYGEGFPVAWCISNREDKLLLMNFFNALKMRV